MVVVVGVRGSPPSVPLAALLTALLCGDDDDCRWRNDVLRAESLAETWLVARHGRRVRATVHIPGQRQARPLERVISPARTLLSRPPRRVVVECPAPLLESVSLARAPSAPEESWVAKEVLLDVTRSAIGMIVVTSQEDVASGGLESLRGIHLGADRVAFVSDRPGVPRVSSGWATSTWYTPADLCQLGRTIEGWGRAAVLKPPEDPTRAGPYLVSDDDDRWRIVLARELEPRRMAAETSVARQCAGILNRCCCCLGEPNGCDDLPKVLESELHALSVRLTRRILADMEHVSREVCGALLGSVPDPGILARMGVAVRGAMENRDDAVPARVLTLTTTAGIAVISGYAALDSLDALGLTVREERLPRWGSVSRPTATTFGGEEGSPGRNAVNGWPAPCEALRPR